MEKIKEYEIPEFFEIYFGGMDWIIFKLLNSKYCKKRGKFNVY